MLGKYIRGLTIASLIGLASFTLTRHYDHSTIHDLPETNSIFSSGQAERFFDSDYDLSYAKSLSRKGYSGFEIYRRAQLDLTLEETLSFTNTSKPDCVVLMTTKHRNADDDLDIHGKLLNGHYNSAKTNTFFKNLQKHYDVWFEFVYDAKDITEARGVVPYPDLLVLAGHGGSDGTTMSEDFKVTKYCLPFRNYVGDISDEGTLLLYACLNAEGENSFAESNLEVLTKKPGRTIYASKMSFSPSEFDVLSYFPLCVTFKESIRHKPVNDLVFEHEELTFSNLTRKKEKSKVTVLESLIITDNTFTNRKEQPEEDEPVETVTFDSMFREEDITLTFDDKGFIFLKKFPPNNIELMLDGTAEKQLKGLINNY